ncbi:MAG TPA: DUF2281 domain-containing protein [Roseiflexaceae bacterium]|nr:DUF2281 domain-containing protein [Roseiflexaceae bacterium]
MRDIPLKEAAGQLPHLVAAALRGEIIYLTDEQQQRVRLIPVTGQKQPRKAGTARGLVTIDPDFDAPLDDFREYMP